MTIRNTLMSRWRFDDVPRLTPIKAALDRVFAVYDDVRAQHAALAKDTKLTPLGKTDQMRKHIGKNAAAELYRAGKNVQAFKTSLDAWRVRLAPKSDGQSTQIRGEMRALIRGMKHPERVRLLMDADCDPELHTAVLEGPAILSGVDGDLRAYVERQTIERTHPGQLAAIEEVEHALAVLSAAVAVTVKDATAAAEFPTATVLGDFVKQAIGNTAHIDADVSRLVGVMEESK